MPAPETLLMALALGLYLYDSALLLYSNEAMLVLAGKNRWLTGFGSNRTTLYSRELYLPNPFTPTRPLFRLSWKLEAQADSPGNSASSKGDPKVKAAAKTSTSAATATAASVNPGTDWTAITPLLRPLAPLVWSLSATLFIGLPVALYGRLGDWFIVWAFVLIYTHVVLMLLLLWMSRIGLKLTVRAFAQMAFDLMLCPPFALNLVRKLSLRVIVKEDFASAAKRLQQAPDWQLTQIELLARLDEEISGEIDGSVRQTAMLQRREMIENAI
jgi:hypothetical protein